MKLIKDIPDWFTKLVVGESYQPSPDRIGVTSLIKVPRVRTLKCERWEDLEVKASDCLNFFRGNCLDEMVGRHFGPQQKLELEIDGLILSGKPDLLGYQILHLYSEAENVQELDIYDVKFFKVHATKYKDTMEDCEAQLNVYDFLRNKLFGKRATKLGNVIVYSNHSKESYDKDYPPPMEIVYQPQWSFEKQEAYVKERIQYHKEKPYDCPEDQRWGSFAVVKTGQKRALRVLPTREECEQWMEENGKGDYIESREARKCKFYCAVSSVCPDSPNCIRKYKELCDEQE